MSESLNLATETTTSKLLEMDSALDASLNDWDEEFSAGSSKTRAEKHKGSLSTDAEPTSGTKDPTKSLKCDDKLQKKSEKAPSTGSGGLMVFYETKRNEMKRNETKRNNLLP